MAYDHTEDSLKTLQDIRSIMERSARFLTLSGWSGVWAGVVALAGTAVAWSWMNDSSYLPDNAAEQISIVTRFTALAAAVFITALAGGIFFTWRRSNKQGLPVWNHASKRMIVQMAIPLMAGGIFAFAFLLNGHIAYVTPACLAFYGMAVINGSKYTLTDIKYLGYLEILLGSICLFFPENGLLFWAIGFGLLHILYGTIMWNKYDKQGIKEY